MTQTLIDRIRPTIEGYRTAPDELPPLWHWALFQEWPPTSMLGIDGHPDSKSLLPHDDMPPARMWAGGRLVFYDALRVGDDVSRTSELVSVRHTTGTTGRLLFATVSHAIVGPRGLAIQEQQDIVYKDRTDAVTSRVARAEPTRLPPTLQRRLVPSPTLLFRFSALTGNAHRIHYDHDFATRVEGHAGIIVHGPLQAILLASLATAGGSRRMTSFAFRAHRPAVVNRPLVLEGSVKNAKVDLRSVDEVDNLLMSATAVLDDTAADHG